MSSPQLGSHYSSHILLLLVLSVLFNSATSETTNFSFPQFSFNESTVRLFGDAQFDGNNDSILMNSNGTVNGTCAMLMYDDKSNGLLIQDSPARLFASFNTSFTFRLTNSTEQYFWDVNTPEFSTDTTTLSTTFALVLTTFPLNTLDFFPMILATTTWTAQPGPCKSYTQGNVSYFGVEFNTGNSFNKGEPSNNFIGILNGVNDQVLQPGSTFNLCGGNQTHCSYLSGGGIFTAWIDFTPQQTLQVRLVNGSHLHTDKPLNPLFEYLSFKLPTTMGDYVALNFVGSSSLDHIKAHELYSWNFYSGGIQEAISSSKNIWIGPTFGALGALATFLVIGCLSWRYAKHCRVVAFNYASGPRKFSYKELCIATKDFSGTEKLGSGAFGTVYKGSFQSQGRAILLAVKRLNFESKHAEATFSAEISSLSQIRHGNVVQLQGWCHEKGRLLLVYDYMSNGGLDEWLHDAGGGNGGRRGVLSLRARHRILVGVAVALEYLHKDCPQCVLHRDIKSSNVMLDADLKAHLGDFGLARLMDHKKLDTTTMAAGTIGYMAPELPYTGKATKASDVYSLGILILEVLSGRRPLDWRAEEPEDMLLLHRVWRAHEGCRIISVADSSLLQNIESFSREDTTTESGLNKSAMLEQVSSSAAQSCDTAVNSSDAMSDIVNVEEIEKKMVKTVLHLGLLCCLPNPEERPTVEDVIRILQEIGDIDSVDHKTTEVTMPPVPDTKPLGLYSSMEFSQTGSRSIEQSEGIPVES